MIEMVLRGYFSLNVLFILSHQKVDSCSSNFVERLSNVLELVQIVVMSAHKRGSFEVDWFTIV